MHLNNLVSSQSLSVKLDGQPIIQSEEALNEVIYAKAAVLSGTWYRQLPLADIHMSIS